MPTPAETLGPPPLPPRRPSEISSDPATSPKPALPPRPKKVGSTSSAKSAKAASIKATKRLADGLETQELHVLQRRFDKQIHHVHVVPEESPRISSLPPLLDLQASPDAHFDPDVLRSNGERLYSTVILGIMRFVKEIGRIRSWGEGGHRTAGFLAFYCIAWWCNLVTASILSFLSILILVPSSRDFFFPDVVVSPFQSDPPSDRPPNPAVVVEGQGPASQTSKSTSSRHEDEEKQAVSFVDTIDDLIKSGSKGKTEMDEDDEDEDEPAPSESKKDEKQRKKEEKKRRKKEQKKQRQDKLAKHGKPIMVIAGDLADGWERWANAFSPSRPFPSHSGRIKVVCSILLPIIISTTIFSEYVFSRVIGAAVGFLFFGQPALDRLGVLLDEKIPGWQEKMELRNGILAGVPTNAQLTLRLLRDAESRLQPLPPPPPPEPTDDEVAAQLEAEEEEDELDSDPPTDVSSPSDDFAFVDGASTSSSPTKEEKIKVEKEKIKGSGKIKLANFIKSTARLTEEGAGYLSGTKRVDWEKVSKATLDKLNISRDGPAMQGLLSIVPKMEEGPSSFFVNHAGRPGHILIYPPDALTKTSARIVFTTVGNVSAKENTPLERDAESKKGQLTISINDILEIRKHGMGWQSRMLVSWTIGLQGVGGTGLELKVRRRKTVKDKELEGDEIDSQSVGDGKSLVQEADVFKFGAIPRRDALFDRLLSLGSQRWEVL